LEKPRLRLLRREIQPAVPRPERDRDATECEHDGEEPVAEGVPVSAADEREREDEDVPEIAKRGYEPRAVGAEDLEVDVGVELKGVEVCRG
jgi:hypothetical protein